MKACSCTLEQGFEGNLWHGYSVLDYVSVRLFTAVWTFTYVFLILKEHSFFRFRVPTWSLC
jgi:hypothetical protein